MSTLEATGPHCNEPAAISDVAKAHGTVMSITDNRPVAAWVDSRRHHRATPWALGEAQTWPLGEANHSR
jgi:hypothetical protein